MKFRAHVHAWADFWLLIRVATLATVLPAGLRRLSLRRLLRWLTPATAPIAIHHDPETYASKVTTYTDFILGRGVWIYKRNCLKRSLLLYHFMRQAGIDVQLCLGVKTDHIEGEQRDDALNGHAWLLLDGQPWQEHASIPTATYTITYRFPESGQQKDATVAPEMALFLACARSRFDPTASQGIDRLLRSTINWPRFLALVRQHGLLTCVQTVLGPRTERVPEHVRATLRTDCQAFTARAMLLSAELVRVTQRLSEADIQVIAYKGPALAQTLYGGTGARHFKDLDVLIGKSDLASAREYMRSQGYRSRLELEWEHSFVRDDLRIMVDVHWALAHQALRLDLPFTGLWRRSRGVMIAGHAVATLGKEDTLIVQCINAAKDDWVSLGQIFEIGQIAVNYDVDWTAAIEQAETAGCKRIVLLGLSLATRLFAAPIPLDATEQIDKDQSVQKLCAEISMRLVQPTAPDDKVMHVARLRARSRERLKERLPHYRRMLRHIVMPNEKDREFLPLPRVLTPLYFFIRPIRLIRKHTGNLFHSETRNTAGGTDTLSR
jgi:hypothetical protein